MILFRLFESFFFPADTFFQVFATEELEADLTLLGYLVLITTVVGILV